MVKKLYEHFVTLYEPIHKSNPTLASEHALKQEDEVYRKSTQATYRVVCPPESSPIPHSCWPRQSFSA